VVLVTKYDFVWIDVSYKDGYFPLPRIDDSVDILANSIFHTGSMVWILASQDGTRVG